MGDHRAALTRFTQALKLEPGFLDARRNLAQTLILLGHFDLAQPHLESLTTKNPDDSSAWYLLTQCYLSLGDFGLANTCAGHAIQSAPKHARNYNLRGLVRDRAGDLSGSLADYQAALDLDPDNVEALVNITLPLARQTRFDEAQALLQRAISIAPDHLGALTQLGVHHVQTGATQAAIDTFRLVLTKHPGNPEAIEQLAQLVTTGDAELSEQAQVALKSVPKRSEARASLLFAQSLIADKTGDAKQAAVHRAEANRVMARLLPYGAAADAALTNRILKRFSDICPQTETVPADDAPTVVYILGLPRSGTTLAESTLGAHPAVAPLGERAISGILLQQVINQDLPFDASAIASFRRDDGALRPDLPKGTAAYTDKMPENYRLIGFLKTVYPQARIIQITRDPRDVALSMWKGHFSGTALNYTYSLTAMAHRFNLYARMMAHWHRVFPGQILTVDYRDLVTETEQTGRNMAQFCGIDWHPDMVRPHETAGPILTMSAAQLRQPVHTRSLGLWHRHADELAPFINGLDPELWPGL